MASFRYSKSKLLFYYLLFDFITKMCLKIFFYVEFLFPEIILLSLNNVLFSKIFLIFHLRRKFLIIL